MTHKSRIADQIPSSQVAWSALRSFHRLEFLTPPCSGVDVALLWVRVPDRAVAFGGGIAAGRANMFHVQHGSSG